jgi:hypothetical protein
LLLTFCAAPVLASGGASCEIKDKSLTFEASTTISRGLGGRFTNFKGEGKVLRPGVAADLATLAFEHEHLVHTWISARELKMLVYREREGDKHGYVELTIETKPKPKEESEFRGTYELTVYDTGDNPSAEGKTVKLRGKVTCSVE